MRDAFPKTSMRSGVQRSSFCAIDSTATFREHVTSTRAPRGIRAVMMWKMVVDLPVPGGPWIFSSACPSAFTVARCDALMATPALISLRT